MESEPTLAYQRRIKKPLKPINNTNKQAIDKVAIYNKAAKVLIELIPDLPPACHVEMIPLDEIEANQYNPNKMAPPESKLLKTSMDKNGITMPILVNRLKTSLKKYVVIDGFHRYQLLLNHPELQVLKGYIPAVVLSLPEEKCMAASVRHNLARGSHQVELTADLIIQLKGMGWTNNKICYELGMDQDEVLRLQQVTGLAAAFKDQDFSQSWE
ncbi:Co-activator of prophage gene expression IbrB [Vibrio chagasii]|uniref:IbrB-like domain-containing protein n=1 Tax=unclassified Vibrio TaxID=2614977 RepID=UPI0002E45276|nr:MULTISPECIES: ParB/RepB/Spo0J family partition protein [Vibrio]CAH6873108.1 Co-activator of prophage gene expression IbrB [Vibrio chagasii]OEF63524.1 chromosome partitioning protein ParB [Vibrio tasmaniensis 1F-187]TKF74088.1 chromosome partitioning protein ParB [Vibrio sp. F13]CAH6880620.1 Co-activator of prophage gene expression IbrB [Vibrio chagasii]CAH6891293.1 Co-activator of prophage gene expression IbrB [Vibrio chagasii]